MFKHWRQIGITLGTFSLLLACQEAPLEVDQRDALSTCLASEKEADCLTKTTATPTATKTTTTTETNSTTSTTETINLALTTAPTGTNNKQFVDIAVSGVSSYKYKLGASATTDCANEAGYSSEINASTNINSQIHSLADGELKLCVYGKASSGTWQTPAQATAKSWTKNSTPIVSSRFGSTSDWFDHLSASDASTECNLGTTVEANCIPNGRQRALFTGFDSRSGLSVSDDLAVFDWECSLVSGEAVFTGTMKSDKGLSDLIVHGDPNGHWRDNYITLSGTPIGNLASSAAKWWTNTIKPLPDSSGSPIMIGLAEIGTVYTVNANLSNQDTILNVPKIAIVGFNNAEIGLADDFRVMRSFNWFENLIFEGAGTHDLTTHTGDVHYWRIKSATFKDAGLGLGHYSGTSYGEFNDLKMEGRGIYVDDLRYCDVYDVNVSHSNGSGFEISGAQYSRFHNITSSNNYLYGFNYDTGSNNSLTQLTLVSNRWWGLTHDGWYDQILAVSAVNNGYYGMGVRNDEIVLNNFVSINSGREGLLQQADDSVTAQFAILNNADDGIYVSANNVNFVGNGFLGNNTNYNCNVLGTGHNISTGNTTNNCSPTGSLNIVSATATGASVFLGKVTNDDTVNTSDSSGSLAYASITDFNNFQNPFRAWGVDGSGFPNADNRDRCVAGTCRIWDYSLSSSDTLLLNKSGDGSTANDAFTAGADCPSQVNGDQTMSDYPGNRTFLINAYEITTGPNKSAGNRNGLCESGDTCMYMPNFGAYQGHGTLSTCTFKSQGGLTNITMYGYQSNGR